MAAFKKCAAAIRKLAKQKAKAKDFEEAMSNFVEAFNKIDSYHSIDTVDREHIYSVFEELVTKTPLTEAQAKRIFAKRDF